MSIIAMQSQQIGDETQYTMIMPSHQPLDIPVMVTLSASISDVTNHSSDTSITLKRKLGDINDCRNDNIDRKIEFALDGVTPRGLAAITEYINEKHRVGENCLSAFTKVIPKGCNINIKGSSRNFQWLPYEEARLFAISLGLCTFREWLKYCELGIRPGNIPSSPQKVYKNNGWTSWGDFLGTHVLAKRHRKWMPFADARNFARSLKLRSREEWRTHCKTILSKNAIGCPFFPDQVYKESGWISWPDFLGNGILDPKWMMFEEARQEVHKLRLRNSEEWREYCRFCLRSKTLPSRPDQVYPEFKGWNDWLGTGNASTDEIESQWMTFNEARTLARSLNLKGKDEWTSYCHSSERPSNIPFTPFIVYRTKGWCSWLDWLGIEEVLDSRWRPFSVAREFIRTLGLLRYKDWWVYCKSGQRPNDIPSRPYEVYARSGWVNWGDWLGTGSIAKRDRRWRRFSQAREFAISLRLVSREDWWKFCKSGKRPSDIPFSPDVVYASFGWKNWSDFLGDELPLNKVSLLAEAAHHFDQNTLSDSGYETADSEDDADWDLESVEDYEPEETTKKVNAETSDRTKQ